MIENNDKENEAHTNAKKISNQNKYGTSLHPQITSWDTSLGSTECIEKISSHGERDY